MSKAPEKFSLSDVATSGTPWPDQVWIDKNSGEQIIRPPLQEKYIFGNPDWPIAPYRDMVVDSVVNNPVTILSSGTGNGKSIFMPQALYESGEFDTVYITQPRIVATRTNTGFIRYQMDQATGRDMSAEVGYTTATEGDKLTTQRIRQHTDGYLLQRLINPDPKDIQQFQKSVFIIDEAHERNPNIDITLALLLKIADKGARILIQSASIDTDRFAHYCSQVLEGADVPIIDIPGLMHPVEERHGGEMHEEIIKYANLDPKNPLNIMALVSGRSNTKEIRSRISKRVPKGYAILELNGDQTIEQQRRSVQGEYPDGKIILSTDIGRQSITIPNLHVVLDGGYHKIGDYRRGVRYLREVPVSRADVIQGMGRVGRTMPGIYEHVSMPGYPPIPRDADGRPMTDTFEVPPIQRTDPSPFILKLARGAMNLGRIDLQDTIRSDEIEYGHHKLVRLGAQALNSDWVTDVGLEMQKLPLDPTYARMLVESRKYGKKIELMVAAMVSACQQEGVTMTERYAENWKHLTSESRSDMLVQLDVLAETLWMKPEELARYNIVEQRLDKACRLLERLCADGNLDIANLTQPTKEERNKIIGCIIAGHDTLFISRGMYYSNDEGFVGRLAKSTKINQSAKLIVGTPLILEHYRNKNLKAHPVIMNATVVTAQQLLEHAPWRCTFDGDELVVDKNGKVQLQRSLYFDGKAIHEEVYEDIEPSRETTIALLKKLFYDEVQIEKVSPKTRMIYQEIERLRDLLIHRSNKSADYEWMIDTLMQNVGESVLREVNTADMYTLVETLHKRKVYDRLKVTLDENSYETEAILRDSPDHLPIDINGDIVEVNVTYKNNKAFIEVPTHLVKYLEGIEESLHGRNVYVWTDSTKKNYLTLHKAIERFSEGNRATRRANKKNGKNGTSK